MTVIHLSPNEKFKVISDQNNLNSVKTKYGLPSEFILTVTRILEGKRFYAGKNIMNIIKAYQESEARKHVKLVVVGRKTIDFIKNCKKIRDDVRKNILPLDFVPQEDLPAIYNQAKFFLFPSISESFGLPITEAMACECPVMTSDCTACPEISGQAAILVNPRDVREISYAIDRLNHDDRLT